MKCTMLNSVSCCILIYFIMRNSRLCYSQSYRFCQLIFLSFQELQDIRSSGIRIFRDIHVDESNILNWQGLIVPVGNHFLFL